MTSSSPTRRSSVLFASDADHRAAAGLIALRYVDNHGRATEAYPANPNGSPEGICGWSSADGRVTVTMPHPERTVRTTQHSWHPAEWRSEEHTSELQSLMRISYDVFCLKKKN